MLNILKKAFGGFSEDECGTRAAALAYSTIFALPALLILLVTIAGKIWGPDKVQSALENQFSGLVGPAAGDAIHGMIAHGMSSIGHGIVPAILGAVGLVLGATGALLALQQALNRAWHVEPDPNQGGVKNFITKRLLSMGMLLGLGFLVAASLALSAAIASFAGMFGGMKVLMFAIDLVVSLIVLTVLFASLFKFLPDAKIAWSDVWVGGLATALLFVIGKFVIGLYLGHSKPGSSFGAASTFAVLLVWIYYAGMIVLFGAEFTEEWALARGRGVAPARGAIRVDREVPAAGHERPVPARGGLSDWIIGLPAVYLLIRHRDKTRRAPKRQRLS